MPPRKTQRALVDELRKFIRTLWTDPQYAETKQLAKEEIHNLLNAIWNFVDIMDKSDRKKIIKRFVDAEPNRFSPGQVGNDYKDIMNVVNKGNIREQMAMIYQFGMNSCDLYWDAIFAYTAKTAKWQLIKPYLNKEDLKKRISDTEARFDLKIADLMKVCKDTKCKENKTLFYQTEPYPTICHSLRFPERGPTRIATRTSITPQIKKKATDEQQRKRRYAFKSSVVPILSSREKAFMMKNKLVLSAGFDHKIKWNTGYSYWIPEQKHINYAISAYYNRLQIQGPSVHTDMTLDVALTFKDTDMFNNFIGSVIYNGIQPDYALSEILAATRSKKFRYNLFSDNATYTKKKNPYDFLQRQIDLKAHEQNNGPEEFEFEAPAVDENVVAIVNGTKVSKIEKMTGQSCENILTAVVIGFVLLLVCNGFYAVICCCKKRERSRRQSNEHLIGNIPMEKTQKRRNKRKEKKKVTDPYELKRKQYARQTM